MRVPLNTILNELEQQKNATLRSEIRRLLPHFIGFSLRDYERVLAYLRRRYAIVPFKDYRQTAGSRLILRHDVEGFLEPAVNMAKVESLLGIKSTYFVLLSSRLYNPAEKAGFEALMEIMRLGHEIGLHYDVSRYVARGRPPRETLDIELRLLSYLVGKPVTAISRHNPSIQSFSDPFAGTTDLMSAYDGEFTVDAHYVSDSCRAWYLEDLLYLLVRNPSRVQLLIHPENWTSGRHGRYEALDIRYERLERENERDKEEWKRDWRTSDKVPKYDSNLPVVRKRLFLQPRGSRKSKQTIHSDG